MNNITSSLFFLFTKRKKNVNKDSAAEVKNCVSPQIRLSILVYILYSIKLSPSVAITYV
jgi:hypothetical protein